MSGILTSTPGTLNSYPGRPSKPFHLRSALYVALAISPLSLLCPAKISSKPVGQQLLFDVSLQSTFLLQPVLNGMQPLRRGAVLALADPLASKQSSGSFGMLSLVPQLEPTFLSRCSKV